VASSQTSSPDKMTEEPSPPFAILKENESGRPISAVRNMEGYSASCVCCREVITDSVFIGIQYTYDRNKYSSLCLPCAASMGIVSSDESSVPETSTHEEKTKTKKQEGENDMGLLKNKMTAAKTTTQETPEEKVINLLVTSEADNLSIIDVDEEEDSIDLSSSSPWSDEGTTTSAPSNPNELRARIDSVESQKESKVPVATNKAVTPSITKSDVQDVVEACLADTTKDIQSQLSKLRSDLKADFNKQISALEENLGSRIAVVIENLSVAGQLIAELTKKLEDALSDDAPTSSTEKAAATTPAPAAESVKREAAPKSTSSTGRLPFAEFLKKAVDNNDGARLEDLANQMIELGYFKSVPEDTHTLYADLTRVLRQRGYQVVDFFVTPIPVGSTV
jgi:hypothetical protein